MSARPRPIYPRRWNADAAAAQARGVSPEPEKYDLVITPTAHCQLAEKLPEAVALAAYEFVVGPLLDNPHRVGTRLRPPLQDRHSARRGTYRVIYRIDDEQQTLSVVDVANRGGAYRLHH